MSAALPRPTTEELAAISERLGLDFPDAELPAATALVDHGLAPFDGPLRARPQAPVRRSWQPSAEENPYGGWACRTDIVGAASGPLAGRSVAIKDCIAVAGVPLTVGTRMLASHVAEADATVVSRILEAGGTILGTATCEALCMSGGSHTSATGVVRNPYDESRTPGGSSTGCAALLASGAVDLAIGSDVVASVRIPAAWTGLAGLKPTYGLVPPDAPS